MFSVHAHQGIPDGSHGIGKTTGRAPAAKEMPARAKRAKATAKPLSAPEERLTQVARAMAFDNRLRRRRGRHRVLRKPKASQPLATKKHALATWILANRPFMLGLRMTSSSTMRQRRMRRNCLPSTIQSPTRRMWMQKRRRRSAEHMNLTQFRLPLHSLPAGCTA